MEFETHTCEVLGTQVIIELPKENSELLSLVWEELRRIEQKYSRFIKRNYLEELNSRLGEWQEVDEETYYLLSVATKVYEESEGAFTLATKELLEQWGYDQEYSFKENNIDAKQGMYELKTRRVKLSSPVEFGGLGKGYAIDQARKLLKDVPSYYINMGGDVAAKGESPERGPWKVLIAHPTKPNTAIGYIELDGQVLAVSAPTHRQWNDYHHLIDPNKQQPAKNVLQSAVIHDRGILADAYATALFVLGKIPINWNCMLINHSGKTIVSKEFPFRPL